MIAEERRKEIIKILNKRNFVKVSELSEIFSVTKETIRSDLNKLENRELLERTHGGAFSINPANELKFNIRKRKNEEEKKEIAKKAQEFIKNGDTLFIDASTTSLFLAKELIGFKDITVITNSNPIVSELSKNEEISVICTGGSLRRNSLSFVGPLTNQTIQNYYANKVFLSCKGVSIENGATEVNELENQIKSNMVKRSNKTIILAKHTAFNEIGLSQFASIDEIDKIITSSLIDKSIIKKFKKTKKEIIIANK
ncbi:rhamnose catabolism operon transcriptional regulator RhaR [Halanaerocella petrolearia]